MARYDYRRRDYPAYPYPPIPMPDPMMGWLPGSFWAGPAMFGWEASWWPPMGRRPYDAGYRPIPPEQSPTYGMGGDRAVRQWAQRHGYDTGYTIQPHPRESLPPHRPGYGRDFRRRG